MTDKKMLVDEVEALYEKNRQRGTAAWCEKAYDFVCPSTGTYPFQWFWDSCFHAIVLAHFDVARARSELQSLLVNQQPDGFIAHVTFWQREKYQSILSTYDIAYRTPYLSDCIQPPVLAEALAAVDDLTLLPQVMRYYDWLDAVRDPDRDGLISVLQADETGLDQTPKFDELIGVGDAHAEMPAFNAGWLRVAEPYTKVGRAPEKMFALDVFNVECVLVNSIYIHNLRVLARLSGAERFRARAQRARDSLVAKCWDAESGLFFDLAGNSEKQLKVSTFTSLMPLLLEDVPRNMVERLVSHLDDAREYAAEFPIPTVPLSSPAFHSGAEGVRFLWRGPSWINSNWYIARGLRTHGYVERARAIEAKSIEMVRRAGFREFYDPHTGAGYGALDFSWSALVLCMDPSR